LKHFNRTQVVFGLLLLALLAFSLTRVAAFCAIITLVGGLFLARRPLIAQRAVDSLNQVKGWGTWGLLAVFSLVVFRSLLDSAIPQGADHTVHLYHAWFMSEQLLPGTGTFTGWSNYQFAGYPAFVLYAPGPYMLIAGLHTIGIPLQSSYNMVLAGAWLGLPLVVYAVLRAHAVARGVSGLAAIFVLIDPGAYNEGGWVQVIEQGVWTGTLSLVFSLLVILALRRLMLARTLGAVVTVALLVGLCLLLHPVSLIILGISAVTYVLVMSRSLADVCRSALAGALGLGLAAWWLWPFIQLKHDLIPHGQPWLSLHDVGIRLWRGTLFTDGSGLLLAAGAYAGVMFWRPKKRFHSFGLAVVSIFVLVATDDVWNLLNLRESSFYEQINFHRLVAPVRVIWWCFAAAAFMALFRQVPWRRGSEYPVRAAALVFGFAFLLQPLMNGFYAEVTTPTKRLRPVTELSYHQDLMDVLAHLNTLESEGPIGRVLVREPRDVHCAQWVPILTGQPIAHPGGKPTFHYRRRFFHHDAEVLRAQGVEWILTCRARPQVRGAKRVFRRGEIALWELSHPNTNPIRVDGEGQASLTEWNNERVVVNVQQATGPVTITIPVVAHPRWQVTIDGEPARVDIGKIHDSAVAFFLRTTVTGPSEVVFRYRRDTAQHVGSAVSFGSCVLLFIILVAGWYRKRSKIIST
jgi:hypothetical protein